MSFCQKLVIRTCWFQEFACIKNIKKSSHWWVCWMLPFQFSTTTWAPKKPHVFLRINLKIHHVHHFVSIFCWRLIDLLGFRFSFCSLKYFFWDLEGILWMTGEGRSCRSFSVATAPGPSALCWPATPQVPWLGDTYLTWISFYQLAIRYHI